MVSKISQYYWSVLDEYAIVYVHSGGCNLAYKRYFHRQYIVGRSRASYNTLDRRVSRSNYCV